MTKRRGRNLTRLGWEKNFNWLGKGGKGQTVLHHGGDSRIPRPSFASGGVIESEIAKNEKIEEGDPLMKFQEVEGGGNTHILHLSGKGDTSMGDQKKLHEWEIGVRTDLQFLRRRTGGIRNDTYTFNVQEPRYYQSNRWEDEKKKKKKKTSRY